LTTSPNPELRKPTVADVPSEPIDYAAQNSVGTLTLILGLCSFASTVSMRLVDPIVPLIADGFGLTLTAAAMLAPVFTLSYAFGQPFIGPVADSFGKVRIIGIALAILAILQVACALAPGFQSLAVARGLAGIAAGGVIPVAMAAIADRVGMEHRQVALSRLLAAMVMGQVAGSFLSGVVGEYAGWRAAFVLAGGFAGIGSLLAFVCLKPRVVIRRDPLDPASIFARYKGVLDNPLAWRLCLLVMVEGMAVFAVFPFAAELLQSRGATGSAEAGTAIAIFGFGGLLYTLVAKQIVGKLGPSRMCALGGIVLAVVLVMLSLPLPRWTAPLLFGLQGLGFYLIHSTYQTQATELSTTARSSAVALFACGLFLGTAMGPISMALFRQTMTLESALFVYAAIVLVLGFVSGPVLKLTSAK
jgi:MFS transporter, YNFM family, putative membrane transport protein